MNCLWMMASLCMMASAAMAEPVTDPHDRRMPEESPPVTPLALPSTTPALSLPSDRWYLELGLFPTAKAAKERWWDVQKKAPSLRKGLCCTMFKQGGGMISYIGPFASFYDADQTCTMVKGTLPCRLLKGEAPLAAPKP